jgi:peroxiredoxin
MERIMRWNRLAQASALLATMTLSGCGGGGGESPSPTAASSDGGFASGSGLEQPSTGSGVQQVSGQTVFSQTVSDPALSGGDSAVADTTSGRRPPGLLPASIGTPALPEPAAAIEEHIQIKRPDEGTPEYIILQITQLRLKPMPDTEDVEELKKARRERNLEIAALATEAIKKTHSDADKEQVFNVAVHRLMDATYQLAMQGDQESIDALYGHADSLFARAPESRAASEAAWFVARFANENAQRSAAKDIRWLQEFSQQARAFADRFPNEQNRAISLLSDAGASCDFYGLTDEAVQCYTAITQKFPESPQSAQVAAPLRRLGLVGKTLDLGGPTLDGGFIQVADFRGAPVLVVFWSTQAKPFVDQADTIIKTVSNAELSGLQVIGVNLDTSESDIDSFMEKSGLTWRNVFQTDAARRGWNNPVVQHYGVQSIPQFWLIDAAGNVVSTSIKTEELEASLKKLLPSASAR